MASADPALPRFNVGVRTIEPSAIRVTLRSPDGQVIGAGERQFPGHSFAQMPAAAFLGETVTGSEAVEIEVAGPDPAPLVAVSRRTRTCSLFAAPFHLAVFDT